MNTNGFNVHVIKFFCFPEDVLQSLCYIHGYNKGHSLFDTDSAGEFA